MFKWISKRKQRKQLKEIYELQEKIRQFEQERIKHIEWELEAFYRKQEEKMHHEFCSAYPNVKPEEIPIEVWREVKKGTPLLKAYKEYLNTPKESV